MQTNTTDQFQVEHIEYVSDQPFDEVVAALEKATGDVTDGKYASEVAAAKDKEDFEKRARSFEPDSGFMRFLSLNHGDFLTLMGFPAKVRQYTIGNPLIAATMLLHDIGAALNVPVRDEKRLNGRRDDNSRELLAPVVTCNVWRRLDQHQLLLSGWRA